MEQNDQGVLSTDGLELHRYTNEDGEFCVDATLGAEPDRPTETIRFKRGDEVCIQKTDGEYLYGEIVGPPVFNDEKSSTYIDRFKALAEDTDRTIIVNITDITVGGSKLPQLTPQQIMVDPSETETFQERLEAFIHKQDMMHAPPEEEYFPEPEPEEQDIGEPA